ncbi:Pro-Pol polyprotein [Araneus ventricosus]|uniref:Pro-Pol polyprotein n=1 Tax=Araneus ventricosus TaxID=182803 RepID=A0A4Y2VYQ4_ARAVE|nr:Pro-Pol polyprotein [Araneus ventricosus]GBO30045.1 Pro-Pol polyprotein [Araneus ventricosus]
MLAEKPVLRIYNPNYETELHTDASLEGYGAILMQKSPDDKNFHPTYYMSKKTTEAEKKYSSYELEALSVIDAKKVEKITSNCFHCILINQKRGKKEGLLHPLQKEDTPLHTYHIDFLGPLQSTNKNYKYVLAIIDAFTKFVWIYPTKSTTSAEVIAKLEIQKTVFGSPFQISSDRGTVFTCGDFADYCAKEEIKHHAITTGLPRPNGQIERINQTITSVLSKLSLENPNKWYKFTNELQQTINSTYQRSIDTTLSELLFGTKMNTGGLDKLKEMVEAEFQANFEDQREN